jgi:hypothetical protein
MLKMQGSLILKMDSSYTFKEDKETGFEEYSFTQTLMQY